MRLNEKMVIGDHVLPDFHLAPSVNLLINVQENIEGSFYRGKVYVGAQRLHIQAFSNPIRHATELKQILVSRDSSVEPILVLYTDGGPDHHLTYVSVQLSLLASFIQLDLDFLCAIRTPPHNSWKNPAERIMSILNLALQSAGIARTRTDSEDQLQRSNNKSESWCRIWRIKSLMH